MFFKEPEIDFIMLDVSVIATSDCNKSTTQCDSQATQKTPALETCDGPEAPSNNCEYTGFMGGDKRQNSLDGKKKETPKQVVGFDLTFDK